MKVKILAFACCVFLFTHSVGAQTATPAADPVSGTWNGHMAREGDRQPLTITLKFDGSSMSGTVEGPPRPGLIRSGTFDKASGALKFEVEVADTSKTVVTFEGGHPPLIQNLGHTNLHYGNLITYMRMLGLVPPSS